MQLNVRTCTAFSSVAHTIRELAQCKLSTVKILYQHSRRMLTLFQNINTLNYCNDDNETDHKKPIMSLVRTLSTVSQLLNFCEPQILQIRSMLLES